MNLSPRSDNGLINSSPISNMPPIVRVQRSCNGRIVVPGIVMTIIIVKAQLAKQYNI